MYYLLGGLLASLIGGIAGIIVGKVIVLVILLTKLPKQQLLAAVLLKRLEMFVALKSEAPTSIEKPYVRVFDWCTGSSRYTYPILAAAKIGSDEGIFKIFMEGRIVEVLAAWNSRKRNKIDQDTIEYVYEWIKRDQITLLDENKTVLSQYYFKPWSLENKEGNFPKPLLFKPMSKIDWT